MSELYNQRFAVEFPAGTRDFSFLFSIRTGSDAQPATYSVGRWCSFPGVKWSGNEAYHLPTSGAEVLFLHSHIHLYDVLRDKSSLYVTYTCIIVSGLQKVAASLFQSQISSHYGPNKGLSIPNPQSLMFLPFLEQLRGLPPAPGGASVNLPQLPHATPPIGKTVATSLASNVSTIPQLCDKI